MLCAFPSKILFFCEHQSKEIDCGRSLKTGLRIFLASAWVLLSNSPLNARQYVSRPSSRRSEKNVIPRSLNLRVETFMSLSLKWMCALGERTCIICHAQDFCKTCAQDLICFFCAVKCSSFCDETVYVKNSFCRASLQNIIIDSILHETGQAKPKNCPECNCAKRRNEFVVFVKEALDLCLHVKDE